MGTISTEYGRLQAIFSARDKRQMSFKTQTSGGLLFCFHVHLASVRLPTPRAIASFLAWPELWGYFQRSWNRPKTQGGVWEAAHPNQAVRWADPWIFCKLCRLLTVIQATATNKSDACVCEERPPLPAPTPSWPTFPPSVTGIWMIHLSQVSPFWFRCLL